jgi:hypothetical protein
VSDATEFGSSTLLSDSFPPDSEPRMNCDCVNRGSSTHDLRFFVLFIKSEPAFFTFFTMFATIGFFFGEQLSSFL